MSAGIEIKAIADAPEALIWFALNQTLENDWNAQWVTAEAHRHGYHLTRIAKGALKRKTDKWWYDQKKAHRDLDPAELLRRAYPGGQPAWPRIAPSTMSAMATVPPPLTGLPQFATPIPQPGMTTISPMGSASTFPHTVKPPSFATSSNTTSQANVSYFPAHAAPAVTSTSGAAATSDTHFIHALISPSGAFKIRSTGNNIPISFVNPDVDDRGVFEGSRAAAVEAAAAEESAEGRDEEWEWEKETEDEEEDDEEELTATTKARKKGKASTTAANKSTITSRKGRVVEPEAEDPKLRRSSRNRA